MAPQEFNLKQREMINTLQKRGINDQSILQAMTLVPRHYFIPEIAREYAYEDCPLSIGYHQTVSQPYVIAYMIQAAHVDQTSQVLEIGTGCGYQAAILGEICQEVYTIEIIEQLGTNTAKLLQALGYHNIYTKIGDGFLAWQEKAPFDAIIVSAAARKIPENLIKQLKVNGRLIIPLQTEENTQILWRIIKIDSCNHYNSEHLLLVRLLPMTGMFD